MNVQELLHKGRLPGEGSIWQQVPSRGSTLRRVMALSDPTMVQRMFTYTSLASNDPVRVTYTALRNAASVAKLILTTETLIGDLEEDEIDPTAGPALGGGAERLGRA